MTDCKPQFWGDKRYHTLNYHLRKKFGEKIFKLSLNAGCTCPNRDGSKGWGGCAFCGLQGAGEHIPTTAVTLRQQMEQGVELVRRKWPAGKYIAYFQAYTNTYAPVAYLRQMYEEALAFPNVVGLAIATRPDCLEQPIIELLEEFNHRTHLWVELGVQSCHNQILERFHTGYTFQDIDRALRTLAAHGIRSCPHIILGLPGETQMDFLKTVQTLVQYPLYGIKLHMFHVLKDSELGKIYRIKPFPVISQTEYIDRLVAALEILPPDVVIHRVTGDGPSDTLLAPNWTRDKLRVLSQIDRVLSERNTWQGSCLYEKCSGD